MGSKISFIVLSNTRSPIRQITVSKSFLYFLNLFLSGCLIFIGFIIYDYLDLKKEKILIPELEDKISVQQDEIESQRKQIQNFAKEINTLKTKLVALNRFEKKIRGVVGIEETDDQPHLFGMGGSIPSDIDTKVQLKKKHYSLMREMHDQVNLLDLATTNQKEGFESFLRYLDDQRNFLASIPAIRPIKGWITSGFGYRKSPITGLREFHKGLDIAAAKGTPIIASADGIVSFAGKKGALGKVIVIDHGHGMVTRYGHIHKSLKKRGDKVKRGETIALVGRTGRTTGSHVHYEVRLNGIPVNPKKYILN